VAAQRYKPPMLAVMVDGVERPALAAALAERGMVVRTPAAAAGGAAAALIREAAARPLCPVVVEAGSEGSAAVLLDGGVDDVVLRSDSDRLVAARLAALVRRLQPGVIQIGDLAIDTLDRRVLRAGQPIPLLPREFALLLYLARHVGVAVDHATLHQALWGRKFDPGTNVITVHVSRLRAKLGPGAVTITTERGKGYRLNVPIAGKGQGG
jgi:two-component system OmpR family response regulator